MERKLVLSLIEDGKTIQEAVRVLERDDEVDVEEAAKAAFSKIKKAEPAFVPHLMYEEIDGSLGELGMPSPYKDEEGRELFVGDVVEIFLKNVAYGKKHLTFVCSDEDGFFVLGIQSSCNSDAGVIDERWSVRKVRDYRIVIDGETYCHAVCVRNSSSVIKFRYPIIDPDREAALRAIAFKERFHGKFQFQQSDARRSPHRRSRAEADHKQGAGYHVFCGGESLCEERGGTQGRFLQRDRMACDGGVYLHTFSQGIQHLSCRRATEPLMDGCAGCEALCDGCDRERDQICRQSRGWRGTGNRCAGVCPAGICGTCRSSVL